MIFNVLLKTSALRKYVPIPTIKNVMISVCGEAAVECGGNESSRRRRS